MLQIYILTYSFMAVSYTSPQIKMVNEATFYTLDPFRQDADCFSVVNVS